MSQILVVTPASRDATWVLDLKINGQKNRVQSCLRKIERLFYQGQKGDVAALLELYEWYKTIRQVEGYFDKEVSRLSKLIKRKVKETFEHYPDKPKTYRLPINNPISAAFYRVISKFDTLMCLSNTCMTLAIFKKRRLFARKTDQYQQSLMRIITKVSQYKVPPESSILKLSPVHKEALSIAIHSDVMPVFAKPTLDRLTALLKEIKEPAHEKG